MSEYDINPEHKNRRELSSPSHAQSNIFLHTNKKNTSRLQWADFFLSVLSVLSLSVWDSQSRIGRGKRDRFTVARRSGRRFGCDRLIDPRELCVRNVRQTFLRTGVSRAFTFTACLVVGNASRVSARQKITRKKKNHVFYGLRTTWRNSGPKTREISGETSTREDSTSDKSNDMYERELLKVESSKKKKFQKKKTEGKLVFWFFGARRGLKER